MHFPIDARFLVSFKYLFILLATVFIMVLCFRSSVVWLEVARLIRLLLCFFTRLYKRVWRISVCLVT